jgi:hypothetical protein
MTFHIKRQCLRQSCRRNRRLVPGGQSECDRVVRDQLFDLIRRPELNYLLTLFAHDTID